MNIEEIAKLSGVSRSTVSRVINDDPNVKAETRERVQTVIKQQNYRPNAAARGLAAGRTQVIGLVIPQGVSTLFTDPYFPLLIQGVSSACNTHDYSVMLWLAEPEFERRMIRQITNTGLIDGVIISSALNNDPLVEALIEGQLPFIMVGRHPNNADVNYVDVDNVNSAREAVSHLLRLGRRRVATITGSLNMVAGMDRLDGYLAALRDRGVPSLPELITKGDFTEAGGYLGMQRLLPHQPDAVFVASDAMAIGALRALRDAEIRVPEQMALVSFDDTPIANRHTPALTTIRQPIQRLGAIAAEALMDLITQNNPPPRRILLPTELVIRESCGANHL